MLTKRRRNLENMGGYSSMCTMYHDLGVGTAYIGAHIISPKVGSALAGASHGYILGAHLNERILLNNVMFKLIW